MLIKRNLLFLVSVFSLLAFTGFTLADVSYNNPVVLGGNISVSVNLNTYSQYIYFYNNSGSNIWTVNLGCGGTCSGSNSFSVPLPSSIFSLGSYNFSIYSFDTNSWITKTFVVSQYSDSPSSCSDGTTVGQCSSTKPFSCSGSVSTGSALGLVPSCQLCGCPTGLNCLSDGTCSSSVPTECSDGTAVGQCSSNSSQYCSLNGSLISDCQLCGCSSGYVCQIDGSCMEQAPSINIPPAGPNEKDDALYTSKGAFLMSDADWENVLPMVSAAVWTDSSGKIHKYPFLLYHNNSYAFDADSVINFLQQYSPDELTLVGDTPQELDNLLVAAPTFGAGIAQDNIQRIYPQDYINYWKSFNSVVYVDDNYTLGLLASTYSSLINVPLIIQGSSLDSSGVYSGRTIICVGSSNPNGGSCSERYNLEQLQNKYKEEAKPKGIVLVNPSDYYSSYYNFLCPSKSTYCISDLYSKTSLLSPIIASAEHELIVSSNETWDIQNSRYQNLGTSDIYNITAGYMKISYKEAYQSIGSLVHSKLSGMSYLTVMASPYAVPIFLPASDILSASFSPGVSLDPYYADLNGDYKPDVGVGRIAGFSSSDVSSYVARDLFLSDLRRTNNALFMGSSFGGFLADMAKNMVYYFKSSGYNANSIISNQNLYDFSPNDWKNKDLVFYADHGSSFWAGISSYEIPNLADTLVDAAACDTVSSYDSSSFWAHLVRQGSIGFLGAVSTTALDTSNVDFLNEVYYNKNTLGIAFKNSYSPSVYQGSMTLIGDPTLNVQPTHNLNHKIILSEIILCRDQGSFCLSGIPLLTCCAGNTCSWFTCHACLSSGTHVNLFTQGKCCYGWHWTTAPKANFCGWCANGARTCWPWDWRLGWNAQHCGTHIANDHKECRI